MGCVRGKGNHLKGTRAAARLGLLALGLGIGSALASMPGTAAADSSSDWLSAVDSFLSGTVGPAASDASGLNLAISFDGKELIQDGTASASTGSNGDFAIAYGAGSSASAVGTDNYAAVYGDNSSAMAGGVGSSTNSAVVLGDDSSAVAGGADSSGNAAFVYGEGSAATSGGYGDTPGDQDIAGVVGDHGIALSGSSAAGAGSDDIAYLEGNDLGTANASGSSSLIDVLKYYDNWGKPTPPSSAEAAESTNHLVGLLSGTDTSGTLADGNAFWTDLFSGDSAGALAEGHAFWADLATSFDAGSVAADASNFWTELATLF
jgi:hypothetical protein